MPNEGAPHAPRTELLAGPLMPLRDELEWTVCSKDVAETRPPGNADGGGLAFSRSSGVHSMEVTARLNMLPSLVRDDSLRVTEMLLACSRQEDR